jgi:hypothetical protein
MFLQFEFLTKDKRHRIVPHVVGRPNPQVLYYIVFDLDSRRVLYAVSPNQIDNFADNAAKFLFAAGVHYPQTEYEVETARMMHHALHGEVGDMFKAWGRSWKAAVTDPHWWVAYVILPAGLGIAARHVLTRSGSQAMQRLQQTQYTPKGEQLTRSARVLKQPETFRHTIHNQTPQVTYAQIEKDAAMRLSTGDGAKYGQGVYAWEKGKPPGSQTYIDIEVPPGTAVETIKFPDGRVYVRMMPPTGDKLPAKIVGSNLTQQEIAQGRRFVASDPGDMMDDVIPPPPSPKK